MIDKRQFLYILLQMRNNIYLHNLPALVVFATVVDKGNLTKAAKELSCSKAAVSRHISNLEDRIGFKLLYRTTRDVSLTSQGKELYNCCASIIRAMDEANQLIDGIISEPRGELRITAPLAFTLLKTKQVIPAFLEKYTKMSIDLTLVDHKVNLQAEGFDVAFWLGDSYDPSFQKILVQSFNMVVCASPSYLTQYGTPENPQELLAHNCIQEEHMGKIVGWMLDRETVIDVKGNKLKSNSGRVAREVALSGLGIAYLPSYLVEDDLVAGSLISVMSDFVKIDLPLYLLYPRSNQHMAKVRSFVEFFEESYSAPH